MLGDRECWVIEKFTISIMGQEIHSHRADHKNDIDLYNNMAHQPMDYFKKWIDDCKISIPTFGITYRYYRNQVKIGNYHVGSTDIKYTIYDMFSISFGNDAPSKEQVLIYATLDKNEYRVSISDGVFEDNGTDNNKKWYIAYDMECGIVPLVSLYSEDDDDDDDDDRSTDEEGPGLGIPSDRQWMNHKQCLLLNELAMSRIGAKYASYN